MIEVRNRAGYRVWSRADIEGALAGLEQATGDVASTIDSYEMRLYWQGYSAALRSFARIFGVDYRDGLPGSTSRPFHSVDSTVSPR